MADSPYKTLGSIVSAVVTDFKQNTNSGIVDMVKRWVNEGHESIIDRKKRDFLNQTIHIGLEAPIEATYSLSNGNTGAQLQSSQTLPFTSVNEHKFKINGFPEVYDVASISSSAVTLASAFKGTTNSAAIGVLFQSSTFLPDTVRSIHKVYHDYYNFGLDIKGAEELREITTRDPSYRDYARYAGLFGLDLDAGFNQRRLTFFPYPKEAYTLHLDCNIYVPILEADTDEPLLPIQHRQILYWYAMAKMAIYEADERYQIYLASYNAWIAKLDGEFMPDREFPRVHQNNDKWQARTNHRLTKIRNWSTDS